MGNGIFITIFLMLLLFNGSSAVAQTQTVEAVVDRHIIHVDETFRLTIRLRGPYTHVTLDLSPLSEDFDLLDTSEHSQSRDINGQTETMTEWIITLAPKRLGELVIPSIHVGRHHSPPVTVTVLSLDQARQGAFTPQANFFKVLKMICLTLSDEKTSAERNETALAGDVTLFQVREIWK